jgi:hypothetical protein
MVGVHHWRERAECGGAGRGDSGRSGLRQGTEMSMTIAIIVIGIALVWIAAPRRRKYDKIDNDRLRSMTQAEINRYKKRR